MTSWNGNVSALLVLCEGTPLVISEFLSQMPVTRTFDIFFDLRLTKRLSKQSRRWLYKTLSRSLWRHCIAEKLLWFRLPYALLLIHKLLDWNQASPDIPKQEPNTKLNFGYTFRTIRHVWYHFNSMGVEDWQLARKVLLSKIKKRDIQRLSLCHNITLVFHDTTINQRLFVHTHGLMVMMTVMMITMMMMIIIIIIRLFANILEIYNRFSTVLYLLYYCTYQNPTW